MGRDEPLAWMIPAGTRALAALTPLLMAGCGLGLCTYEVRHVQGETALLVASGDTLGSPSANARVLLAQTRRSEIREDIDWEITGDALESPVSELLLRVPTEEGASSHLLIPLPIESRGPGLPLTGTVEGLLPIEQYRLLFRSILREEAEVVLRTEVAELVGTVRVISAEDWNRPNCS